MLFFFSDSSSQIDGGVMALIYKLSVAAIDVCTCCVCVCMPCVPSHRSAPLLCRDAHLKPFSLKDFHMKFVAVTRCTNKQACCNNSSHANTTRTHSHVGAPLFLTRVILPQCFSLFFSLFFVRGRSDGKVLKDQAGI